MLVASTLHGVFPHASRATYLIVCADSRGSHRKQPPENNIVVHHRHSFVTKVPGVATHRDVWIQYHRTGRTAAVKLTTSERMGPTNANSFQYRRESELGDMLQSSQIGSSISTDHGQPHSTACASLSLQMFPLDVVRQGRQHQGNTWLSIKPKKWTSSTPFNVCPWALASLAAEAAAVFPPAHHTERVRGTARAADSAHPC